MTSVGGVVQEPSAPGAERAHVAWAFLRTYVLGRAISLFVIVSATFFAMSALGVSIARRILGRSVTPEQLAAFNRQHGLDRPILVQYGDWLAAFVRGDWGTSPATALPIRDVVLSRLGPTLILAAIAFLIAVPASIAIGQFAAKRVGRPADFLLSIVSVCVAATPAFVVGLVLVLVFAVWLGIAPVDSTALVFGSPAQKVAAYVLPALTVAIWISPEIMRVTRASVWDTLSAPYTQAAVLRGLSRHTVTTRYLLPGASGPIVNVVALSALSVLTGLVVVENVFAFPGLGSLLVSSVRAGDTFTVQAIIVVTGIVFLVINVAADLQVLALNPRLRT